jgi:hypothetical protein
MHVRVDRRTKALRKNYGAGLGIIEAAGFRAPAAERETSSCRRGIKTHQK